MRLVSAKWMLIAFLSGSLLFACGGGSGGGGADSVSITSYATTTVYIEAASTLPLSGFDPNIYGVYQRSSNWTTIYLYSGYTSSYNVSLQIQTYGNSAGTFTVASGQAIVTYSRTSPRKYFTSSSGAGSITITKYEEAGGQIQGTFRVSSAFNTNLGNGFPEELSGSFCATRIEDVP